VTSKEKVLKMYPKAKCDKDGYGRFWIYLQPHQGSIIGMAKRESWAWAEALRRINDTTRGAW
jgi:hypothetical protein